MVFPVVMYGCDSWTIKRLSTKELMLKILESPLDCEEIKSVYPKGNKFWTFIGRTDAEAEAPILWPPDVKSIRKDLDPGKDWRQQEKGMTEEEMIGWHHQLNGHEFEQAPGDGKKHGSLSCCSPWGHKESDITERLDNNNKWRRHKYKNIRVDSQIYWDLVSTVMETSSLKPPNDMLSHLLVYLTDI